MTTFEFKKIMRFKSRDGQEGEREIGRFVNEDHGYRVTDIDGSDIGYFGPDKYESIAFESHSRGSLPDQHNLEPLPDR